MGSVDIRHGDMFDGPCDMIVIPCSTGGTITGFVQHKLDIYGIVARPEHGAALGSLSVHPFLGGESIAQFVAFAVSVRGTSSSPEAIYRIGCQLGEHTEKNSAIRRISAPLLGAGAGGLQSELVVKNLKEGFAQKSHANANLVINILHQDVYERIASDSKTLPLPPAAYGSDPSLQERPPRIFISYSHTSPDHKEWVASLGEFLRHNGVDARLDIWHLRRGMDVPQFMTNELTLADPVIIISDERYAEKADGRVGGVGWETMIVQGDMGRLPPDSTKYLVLVRSSDIYAGLPQYLKTKFVIHWPQPISEKNNQELILREIFDVVRIPSIGKRPIL